MTHPDDKKPDTDQATDTPPEDQGAGASDSQDPETSTSQAAQSAESEDEASDQSGTDTQPEPTRKAPKRKRASRVRSAPRRRAWVWPLVSLILLALLVYGGYWGYQYLGRMDQNWQNLSSDQNRLEQTLGSLQSRLQQSEQARDSLEQALRRELAAQEEMLVETAQRLSRRQDLEADRWPLEEALALLRLAERRLQLDQNADIALRLLDAADQVLAGLTQAAVLPVRRQIADDRLALKSVESPDINGLYFRLDAVHRSLADLDWTPETQVTPDVQPDAESPWNAFVDSLGSLVTVTRLDTAYQAPPLLDDFAQWRQHALLLTEQAQLAVLAANQDLFDDATQQLNAHLQPMRETLRLQPLITELSDLNSIALNPDWPDIHGSVRALEDYMARAESEEADGASETDGETGEGAE